MCMYVFIYYICVCIVACLQVFVYFWRYSAPKTLFFYVYVHIYVCMYALYVCIYIGKVWTIFDKKRGKDILFNNRAHQPANIAALKSWYVVTYISNSSSCKCMYVNVDVYGRY